MRKLSDRNGIDCDCAKHGVEPSEWEDTATETRLAKEEVRFGIVFGFVVEETLTYLQATLDAHLRAESLSMGTV